MGNKNTGWLGASMTRATDITNPCGLADYNNNNNKYISIYSLYAQEKGKL
jgi:hypothetical protein